MTTARLQMALGFLSALVVATVLLSHPVFLFVLAPLSLVGTIIVTLPRKVYPALSLAFLALFCANVFLLMRSIEEKINTTRMTREYETLWVVVHAVWGNSSSYGAVGTDMMPALAKAIPLGFLRINVTTNTATSPYGHVTVFVSGTDIHRWVTTYPAGLAIPKAVCLGFVTSILALVRSVTVADAVVTTPTDAATHCADGVDIVVTSD